MAAAAVVPKMTMLASPLKSADKLSRETLIATFQWYTNSKKVDQNARRAIARGNLSDIIQLAKVPATSKVSIKEEGIRRHTVRGIRSYPQKAGWKEGEVTKALKQTKEVATLLNSKETGYGMEKLENDPREALEVLGTFLEVAAVHVYRFREAQDTQGTVKAAAARLLSQIEPGIQNLPKNWDLPAGGEVDVVLDTVPIYHGLVLAQEILGNDMPEPDLAKRVVAYLRTKLKKMASQLEATSPKEGSYRQQALRAYQDLLL